MANERRANTLTSDDKKHPRRPPSPEGLRGDEPTPVGHLAGPVIERPEPPPATQAELAAKHHDGHRWCGCRR